MTITDTDDKKTILNNPTNNQLRGAISKMGDNSIKKLEIAGHGYAMGIDTGVHDTNSQGISISGVDAKGNPHVSFDDTHKSFADFVGPKMAENSQICLNGCNTANNRGWLPFGIGNPNNISKVLSQELPGVEVTGYRGFGLGNQISNPFNRDQALPQMGSETHTLGIPRTYLNGDQK